jgi:1,4-dihydroxy-2-naphthoate octaprenyltransferase
MTNFKYWVMASRPRTLLAAVVPVMVGSALAIYENSFNFIYSFVALLCSLLIQVGTNFTNDLYDYLKGADTENRKGPQRVMASGFVTVKEMEVAVFLTFILAFFLGMYLVYTSGILILIIGIVSIIAGLAYTAGPYPLAYNGLGDIFVFIFFGIVGTMGTHFLHSHEVTMLAFIISLPVGALITNILVVNNFRDMEEDKTSNKYTLNLEVHLLAASL